MTTTILAVTLITSIPTVTIRITGITIQLTTLAGVTVLTYTATGIGTGAILTIITPTGVGILTGATAAPLMTTITRTTTPTTPLNQLILDQVPDMATATVAWATMWPALDTATAIPLAQ